MSVTADEILRAARARQAAITAETAGYLVLAVADASGEAPGELELAAVHLNEDGSVTVLGTRPKPLDSLVGELRRLLGEMLAHAPPGAPALARAALGHDTGFRRFISELEAALIPVNRSAARRALSRLQRDVVRARKNGTLAPPTPKKAPLEPVTAAAVAPLEPFAAVRVVAPPTPALPPAVETAPSPSGADLIPLVATPKLPPEALAGAEPEVVWEPRVATPKLPPEALVDPAFAAPLEQDLSAVPEPASEPSVEKPRTGVRPIRDSLVETLLPPPVFLATPSPAPPHPPATVSDDEAAWSLAARTAPRPAWSDRDPEATPFLGSLEVVLRRSARFEVLESAEADTERLPAVNWDESEPGAAVDSLVLGAPEASEPERVEASEPEGADRIDPAALATREPPESAESVPMIAAEGLEAAELIVQAQAPDDPPDERSRAEIAGADHVRPSLPAPKSWVVVPPVVRALRVQPPSSEDERLVAVASESEAVEEVSAFADPDPIEPHPLLDVEDGASAEGATLLVEDEAESVSVGEPASLFDLSDDASPPAPAGLFGPLDTAVVEARQSLIEARESLIEARESLLEVWDQSSAVHARVAPVEPDSEAPAPTKARSEPVPLYRPRQSDVRELLSQFVVAEAKSLRDLARELKSIAGVYATPAPPAVAPIAVPAPEEALHRR